MQLEDLEAIDNIEKEAWEQLQKTIIYYKGSSHWYGSSFRWKR